VTERVLNVFQQFLAMCTTVGVRSALLLRAGFLYGTSTPKYHAADKHDTPSSHDILTLFQPDLF